MVREYYKQNMSFKDKVLSLDYILILLILILGIVSIFAMYSTERGNFDYYTKSHIYRFLAFFIVFLILSFLNIKMVCYLCNELAGSAKEPRSTW